MQSSIFVERIYQQIELEMFENIGKLIGDNLAVTDGVVHWQVEPLSRMGTLRDDQLKVIAKYANMSVNELNNYIADTALAEVAQVDKDLKPAFDAGVKVRLPVDSIYRSLLVFESQAVDLTNLMTSSMLAGSEQVYRDIITKATADVTIGSTTLDQAVKKVAKEWANKGMPVLVDSAGRTWSAEGYLSTAIRTTTKNVATKAQSDRLDEYEVDLVEISSHAGSRPTHEPYQGRIYSRSGRHPDYPPLSSTTYGDVFSGLVTGINCRHRMYAFIEGLSTQTYEPYDKAESERIYKESQKQRYLERQIRRAKKELGVLDALKSTPAEIKEAKDLIKQRQFNMRQFIKETKRTRQYGREQIVIGGN